SHTSSFIHTSLRFYLPPSLTSPLTLFFFFYCSGAHRDLHSFPTRRSSDLGPAGPPGLRRRDQARSRRRRPAQRPRLCPGPPGPRSEEHTSELQSRRDLVCRLLLEKKKKNVSTSGMEARQS